MQTSRTRTVALLGAGLALALAAPALAKKGSEDDPGKGMKEKVEKVESREEAPELEPAAEPQKTAKAPGKGRSYVFVGKVVALDVASDTLTVSVSSGNRHARGVTPKQVVFDVSAARYKVLDRDADGARTLTDVLVGEPIKVKARPSKGAGAAGKPFAASKVEGRRGVESEDEQEDGDAPVPVVEPAPVG